MAQSAFSPAPYKGTRDFYPNDLQKRNYMFDTWRKVLTKKSFEEYETSILENAEIYIAKSGEELGGKQLYNFHDKGDRFIALRPEQTPSLARIVANKYGELKLPLRWFSIPNCFRYERPQKGRLREHWQLNVDVIGCEAGYIELEILSLLGDLFRQFGADSRHFKINYNHREVLDEWLAVYGMINKKHLVYSVLDDWYKLTPEENRNKLQEELSNQLIDSIFRLTQKVDKEWDDYLSISRQYKEINIMLDTLPLIQPELEYDLNPCIIRGISYYTGIVFEAFDKNPDNPRALFGGGRYDNLLDLFGKKAPAIGFGWGDVTMNEFLEYWELYPDFSKQKSTTGLMLIDHKNITSLYTVILPELEQRNIRYVIDYDIDRSENKRYESLKKRGCSEIIKV